MGYNRGMDEKQRDEPATVDIGRSTRARLKAYVDQRNLKLGAEASRIVNQYLDRVDARKARKGG